MVILVDFDSTCVTHGFPGIGHEIGAAPVLKKLTDQGHKLILFTMRSNRAEPGKTHDDDIEDVTGNFLDDAVNWFKGHDIPLYGIQTNPGQHKWTTSPKAYGTLIIDDIALGIPLIVDKELCKRPFVDWVRVELLLLKRGILKVTNVKV
jgi:hypothetical protein